MAVPRCSPRQPVPPASTICSTPCSRSNRSGIFKPDRRVYQIVLDRFGVAAGEVSFQSSNCWDAAGAAAFGFAVVWINRKAQPREYTDAGPMREAHDLTALLDG